MSTEPPPSRLKRMTAWYASVADIFTPRRIALGVVALALGGVGLYGGWDAVGDAVEEIPAVETDAAFTATPFEITVTRARVFDELDQALYPEEGFRYLAVVADVTNTSNQAVSAGVLANGTTLEAEGLRSLELRDGPQVMSPSVIRTSDSLVQRTFQPGLTTHVVLVWQQDTSAAIPEDASVVFSKSTWRRSTLGDGLGWRDATPAARITLPIEPLDAA